MNTIQQKVYTFFEAPESAAAKLFRGFIVFLILFSIALTAIEIAAPDFSKQYSTILFGIESGVIAIFSIEYILRFWSAPNKKKFFFNFYNLIDLVAIVPFFIFIGSHTQLFRIARILRLLRSAKLLRQFWQTNTIATSRLIQENVAKNIIAIVGLVLTYPYLTEFLESVDSGILTDIMFASSIVVLAAMFGFFSLPYSRMKPSAAIQRFLMHLTTGMLLYPIGVMFLMIQIIIAIQVTVFPTVIVGTIWLVYGAVVLWDFWNVLQVQEQFFTSHQ